MKTDALASITLIKSSKESMDLNVHTIFHRLHTRLVFVLLKLEIFLGNFKLKSKKQKIRSKLRLWNQLQFFEVRYL